MSGSRWVNGIELMPFYGWNCGDYVISTDSLRAAEAGTGYFTVGRVTFDDSGVGSTVVHLDYALSLADAVTLVLHNREYRRDRGEL